MEKWGNDGKDNLLERQRGEDQRTRGGEPECWQEVRTSWLERADEGESEEGVMCKCGGKEKYIFRRFY